jgi:hypothetical protein
VDAIGQPRVMRLARFGPRGQDVAGKHIIHRLCPGCAYTNCPDIPDFSKYVDVDGRKVVAVADGEITSVVAKGSGRDSSLVELTYTANGKKHWVQYVHVNSKVGAGPVSKGTVLGWYGPYGMYGNFLHLHLSLKVDGVLADPEPYLP